MSPENTFVRLTYIELLNSEERYSEAIEAGQEGIEGKDLTNREWYFQGLRAAYAEALVKGGLKHKAIEQYRILVDQGRSIYQWQIDRLLK